MGTQHPNAGRNGTRHLTMFPGNGQSVDNLPAGNARSPRQLMDQVSNTSLQSELGHEFLWDESQFSYAKAVMEAPRSSTLPSRSTEVKADPQQVLDSLFKIPEMRTYEPSSMDWKKVVKKLQSFNSTATSNNQQRPKTGDGYREFRGVAARHYDKMKEYYQKVCFLAEFCLSQFDDASFLIWYCLLSICFSLTGCPRIFERRQIICCLPC
jgi:hypothetical protein